jgi:SAM-dependent methyltransferase
MSDLPKAQHRFENHYRQGAPWVIGRPQPAVVRLYAAGGFAGRVLDAGCGTGDNAIFLARQGLPVVAIDFVPAAIETARRAAERERLPIDFRVADILQWADTAERFDTVLDSGLFHVFPTDRRGEYVRVLALLVSPGGRAHVLCFSDREPGTDGPLRITQAELLDAFRYGWSNERLEAIRFEAAQGPGMPRFSPGGPHAWLATFRRRT